MNGMRSPGKIQIQATKIEKSKAATIRQNLGKLTENTIFLKGCRQLILLTATLTLAPCHLITLGPFNWPFAHFQGCEF